MELKGKYQIDEITITNPIIEVGQVVDNINTKEIKNIEILFKMDSLQCSRNVVGFKYESTWEDKDIIEHVIKELEGNKLK